MNQAVPMSDLSSDPRNAQDRLRATQPLEYPGPWIPGLDWSLSTVAAVVIAAAFAITFGLWLGGRGRKKAPGVPLPSVNKAELAVELAPVIARLMKSPAIRAYVLRMLVRSLTRKVTG
jgi:hypothetical protein